MHDNPKYETLDPENWDNFRTLGYRMIDDIIDSLQNDTDYHFKPPPDEAIKGIRVPLSEDGEGEEQTYETFLKHIAPYSTGKRFAHPNYWGWVVGSGTPYGILTQMLMGHMVASGENLFADGQVHRQAVDWIRELLGFPPQTSGIIVSGGSEANFTGLAVARNAKAKVDMKVKGVQNVPHKMTLYVSDEGHHCLERSVELLGLGNENLRWIKTDDDYQIKVDALKTAIENDSKSGFHPFCIIGNAGTVNGGAFDDFNVLRQLADKEDMWLHVDGAFGAWVKLSDTHRNLAEGMEKADSLAVDLHKWMNMPYGIGCTLVKDRLAHYSTFVYGHEAEYLKSTLDRLEQLGDKLYNSTQLSLALSREYKSLKAYMLLRAYGRKKYSRLVQQNLDLISYLADSLRKDPVFEVTAPVVSNIVCFRYRPLGFSEEELEKLNKLILESLYERYFGIVSDTVMKGKYSLRACCVCHRSRREDFDFLVNEVKRIGEKLTKTI
jgi:glutamate/tyrosine decarboxylase-like PLP-dependent enzyme